MNNYSALPDIVATAFMLLLLAVLAYNLIVSWYFGRKGRKLYRRGGM